MPRKGYTVYIVEADTAVREALAVLLSLEGYAYAMFDSLDRFLGSLCHEWLGCVLIDARCLGGHKLRLLQRNLRNQASALPMIVMSALGNIATMPLALYSATTGLLDKPLRQAHLIASVERAFQHQDRSRRPAPANLSEDEREIVELIARGLPRREIARALFLSPQVVADCVAALMRRLGARDVQELPLKAALA